MGQHSPMWEDSAGQGMLRDCILLCDDGVSLEIASYLGTDGRRDDRACHNFRPRQNITFHSEGVTMRPTWENVERRNGGTATGHRNFQSRQEVITFYFGCGRGSCI